MNKVLIGAHLSIAGGLHKSIERAESIGATALQIFSKSSRSLKAKPITDDEAELFKKTWKNSAVDTIAIHTAYILNLGSPNAQTEKNSVNALLVELKRCDLLEIPYIVLHPGSHLGTGEIPCIKRIARNLNNIFEKHSGKAIILLETMAGQGTNVGYKFEHLRDIFDLIKDKTRVAFCLDTCHIFAAGYDLTSPEGYHTMMKQFSKVAGLRKLKFIHINDSKTPFNSHKDRHANIGKGKIPISVFKEIMNDKRLFKIGKVLETPFQNGLDGYRKEISLLKRMIK